MKPSRPLPVILLAACAASVLFLLQAPLASGQPPGTPASLDWEQLIFQETSTQFFTVKDMDVSSDGFLYLAADVDDDGISTPTLYQYDRQGNQRWAHSFSDVCPGDCFFFEGSLRLGLDRQAYVAVLDNVEAQAQLFRVDSSGTRTAEGVDVFELSGYGSLTGSDTVGTSFDDLRVWTSSRTSDRLLVLDYSLQNVTDDQSFGDVERIKQPNFLENLVYSVRDDGSSFSWQVRNSTTLAVEGTRGNFARAGILLVPTVQHTDTSTAFGMFSPTAPCSDCIRWSIVDSATFAAINGTVAPDDSRIHDGAALQETQWTWWDLAGDDSLLTCGLYDHQPGPGDSFVARFQTFASDGEDRQDWNITIEKNPLNAAGSNHPRCMFDFVSGFWVYVHGGDGSFETHHLQHYKGGGFEQPTPRAFFETQEAVVPEPAEFDSGFRGFVSGVGFRTPESQMLVALILIGVAVVAIGSMTKLLSPGRLKNGIIVGTSMGVGFFAAVLFAIDLWMTTMAVVLGAFIIQGGQGARNTLREIREDPRGFLFGPGQPTDEGSASQGQGPHAFQESQEAGEGAQDEPEPGFVGPPKPQEAVAGGES